MKPPAACEASLFHFRHRTWRAKARSPEAEAVPRLTSVARLRTTMDQRHAGGLRCLTTDDQTEVAIMRPAIGLIASTALVGTLAGLAGIAHAAPAPLKVKSVQFTATPAPANG